MLVKSRQRAERFISWLFKLAAGGRQRRRAELARQAPVETWQDHDLVFCQPDGRPWNPDYVSRRFKRLAAQAGVPGIKLHEARHSAISLMRDAGVDTGSRWPRPCP